VGLSLARQFQQLGGVHRNPSRLILAEQLGCGATGRNDLYLLQMARLQAQLIIGFE
jgi:hypothetical protein